jgi:methylmalonyl-CoA mutase N-terminal domain/subunit
MYRSKLWTMRMFAGFGTATDTNQRFKEIIAAGGDGLSTAFDMPTLLGLDSDDEMASARWDAAAWPSTRWPTCRPLRRHRPVESRRR